MKKKLSLTLFLLGIAGVMSFGAVGQKTFLADASAKSRTIVSDNFNDASLTGKLNTKKWTSYTEKKDAIVQNDGGESYAKTSAHASGCELTWFGSKKLLTGIQTVSFDLKILNPAKWVVFNVYNKELTATNFDSVNTKAYSADAIIYNNILTSWTGSLSPNLDIKSKLGADISNTWISFKIDVQSPTTAKMNACVAGGSFVEANATTLTLKNGYTFNNAICGIQIEHGASICLDNFSIATSEETYSTSFETLDFEDNEYLGFVTKGSADHGYKIEGGASLGFNQAKQLDFIASRAAISKDLSIVEEVKVATAKFKLRIPADSTDKVAVGFGVNTEIPLLCKNSINIEFSGSTGVVKEYGADGQISDDTNNTFSLATVHSAAGSDLVVEIYKSGRILITENASPVKNGGSAVTFDNITNYDGLFAVGAISDVTSDITFDDIIVTNDFYYVPVTKSVTHNFTDPFIGNEGFEDFVLMEAGGYKNLSIKGGRLCFEAATDGTMFGSAHQYDSFILDFKLVNIKADFDAEDPKSTTIADKWIGLDLSRERPGLVEYGSYINLITMITRDYDDSVPESQRVINTNPWINEGLSPVDPDSIKATYHKGIPYAWFDAIQYKDEFDKSSVQAGDAVCFRYVSDGSSIKFYAKRASDIEFTLFSEYSNIELNGYFAICCTGYTYMELDDFSMANTSAVYVCADSEAPETIIKEIETVIYDDTQYDINWDEEKSLNGNVYVWAIVLMGVFAATTVAGLATIIVLKKKGKK